MIPDVFPLQRLFRVLVINFVYYLSIWSWVINILFPCFTPKFFYFLCICLLISSCAFSNPLVGFSFIILVWPVFFALFDPVTVSFKSPFFRQYLLIYLYKFFWQTCLFCLGPFILTYTCVFFLPKNFRLLLHFLYLSFSP